MTIPPTLDTATYQHLFLELLYEISGGENSLRAIPSILDTGLYRHLKLEALNYIANKNPEPQPPTPPPPTNGLLAFWRLSDTSDSSGNGNTLTNINGVTFVPGLINNAGSFSKALGSRLLSTMAFNTAGVDFSISTWVKIEPNTQLTVFLGTGTSNSWNMYVTPGNVLTFNSAGPPNFEAAGFVRNVWNHVFAKNEGGTASLYLNGVLVDGGTWNGSVNSPDVRLQSAFGDQQGDFLMDATGLWDRALTSAEIAYLYNNGNGREI